MKSIFPMPNSDPVQNYSLNFKDQKEENLAKNRPVLATRRLVQLMFQVSLASRRHFLLHERPFFTQKNHSCDREEVESYSCQLFMWRSSVNSVLQNGYTIRPVLLKAFAKRGARYFSDQQWLRLIHDVARQELSSARISEIPWLTFEPFKDTLVEYQLTLS